MKKVLIVALVMFAFCIPVSAQFTLTSNGFVSASEETKDYVVVDVPNMPQNKLFQKTKMYLNTLYNNPKYVTAEVDNEQIAIDAIDSKDMRIIFVMNGPNIWQFSYKYVFTFKDNKIKFNPYFKSLINTSNNSNINLIGASFMGTVTGLFDKKGKCLKEKAKEVVELSVNNFIKKLTEELNKPQTKNDNW